MQSVGEVVFDASKLLVVLGQNLLQDQFALFRGRVLSSFLENHFFHHAGGLVNQDLRLQIVDLNLLVFPNFIVFDLERASHQLVQILTKCHFIEEIRIVIQVLDTLKQLKIL